MRIDPLKMSESNKMSKPNVHNIEFLHREQKRNLFRNIFKVSSLGTVSFIFALSSVWMLSSCNSEANEGYQVYSASCVTEAEVKRTNEHIDLNWNDWQKQCTDSCSGKLHRLSSMSSKRLYETGVSCICSNGE